MDMTHVALALTVALLYALGAIIVAERDPLRVALFWPFVALYALIRGFFFDDPRDL